MNKLRKIIFIFVITFCFIINANAVTIKEDASTYNGDVYIIGSSKFDNNTIITGPMATKAGARESFIQFFINMNYEYDPDDLAIHYYSSTENEWYILPEKAGEALVNLSDEEVKELTDNLNIYYVNDVEKTNEVEYDVPEKEGYELEFYTNIPSLSEHVKYENGKLIIPVTVQYLETQLVKDNEVILLDSFNITEEEIVADSKVVTTLSELKDAIANEESVIRLGADIIGINETIIIPYTVEFRGAGHKLAFENVKEVNGGASGLVLQGDESYVDYLTLDMNSPKGWDSHYALQVYGANFVNIDGFTATNSDAALLVNGSSVNLYGKVNLTGNEYGGIEVSKGSDEQLPYGQLYLYTHVTMDDETVFRPAVWLEKVENPIPNAIYNMVYDYSATEEEPSKYTEDVMIPIIRGKNQTYYYASNVYEVETINVANESDFKVAMYLENVKEVTLVDDIDFETAMIVDKKLTVNLNNHNLTITNDTVGDGVFHVIAGGDLTINGDGVINGIGNNDYNMAIWADGGKVTVNGGTYTNVGATAVNDPTHMDLMYVKNGGEIIINGGRFEAETPKWTLNSHDTLIGTITVKGGTFVNYNPSNSNTEPEKVNTNFVAEGYTVVENNGVYTVQSAE